MPQNCYDYLYPIKIIVQQPSKLFRYKLALQKFFNIYLELKLKKFELKIVLKT